MSNAFLSEWFSEHRETRHKKRRKVVSISAHEFKKVGRLLANLEYMKVKIGGKND
jgi:hypothetical protein